jgi:hypothetical protein
MENLSMKNGNMHSVIGMLMYLSNNAYPEIQFAVHQCARFTHFPRNIHAKAVKRICRYLKMILVKRMKKQERNMVNFQKKYRFET